MSDMIDTMAYNRSKGTPWHGKGVHPSVALRRASLPDSRAMSDAKPTDGYTTETSFEKSSPRGIRVKSVLCDESFWFFVAALGFQLLVGGLAWVAGWRTYGGFLVWFVLTIEIGGVAVVLWIQRLIFLPLLRISAGFEVLDATLDWRAWTDRARAEEVPPPLGLCRMGPDETLYRQQVTRWTAWTWWEWGLVTAATGIAWWTFSYRELFR